MYFIAVFWMPALYWNRINDGIIFFLHSCSFLYISLSFYLECIEICRWSNEKDIDKLNEFVGCINSNYKQQIFFDSKVTKWHRRTSSRLDLFLLGYYQNSWIIVCWYFLFSLVSFSIIFSSSSSLLLPFFSFHFLFFFLLVCFARFLFCLFYFWTKHYVNWLCIIK